MLASFCRRTTVSEFYSGETYRVGSDKVSEAVKILSRIERVRTRKFENKSEGEFYSVFPGLYKKYFILDVHKEQRVS